jgi:Acetyltransferases, including N-acetylases of ribosomal proteins
MRSGEHVTLGPLRPSDGPSVFAWLNDPAIAESNGTWRPTDGMDFTQWFNALGRDASRVTFAIRPADEARLAGYLSILAIHPVFRTAEMGVTIGDPKDRGRGWGRDAMRLGMAYCWTALNLERISLKIYGDNPAALRCYQGAGFQVEGVLRRAAFLNGRRLDVTVMGALRP